MSRKCTTPEIKDTAKSGDGVFVLFYADWCPFSQAFLPVYEKHARGREGEFVRIVLDGNEELFNEHRIEVYPTVLFFRAGRVDNRLDGRHLVGLKEKQLTDLISACGKSRD